ncbi:DUF4179 domain-containing protein [Bacillus rubiinfantis]|uniref:DUF4179 domain-containing protein n=1 Tax=Bacillus rubiinfantis TaxID=1499680 RepID=UPI0005A7AC57|nr:DUF4179 domain-containing protein [Bacillus rubiinfantis]
MEKEKLLKHLNQAIEKQVPDAFDEIIKKIDQKEEREKVTQINPSTVTKINKSRKFYKRLSMAAAIGLLAVSALSFTPVMAAIQETLDKLFFSKHIDDTGLRMAIDKGQGQPLNQTYYDDKHDITVHFQSVLTDEKETKLLVTYQSKKTNLKNYYLDIFEGRSSINLVEDHGDKKKLHSVGWGSRYYDAKENKVVEAESFESLKQYQGQKVRLVINNLTIYNNGKTKEVTTTWPLEFTLGKEAVSTRETVELNKEFTYKNQQYRIKQVEFSAMETRVVVTGTDTKLQTDEAGNKYKIMSKLEEQFLHARKIDKKYGYIVDEKKSGVFLQSAGKRVDPIFSKGEVQGADDEYIMIFAPVENRKDCTLEIGKEIKLPLSR